MIVWGRLGDLGIEPSEASEFCAYTSYVTQYVHYVMQYDSFEICVNKYNS